MNKLLRYGLMVTIPAMLLVAVLLFVPVYQAENLFRAALPQGDSARSCTLGRAAIQAWDSTGIGAGRSLKSDVDDVCRSADLDALYKKSISSF